MEFVSNRASKPVLSISLENEVHPLRHGAYFVLILGCCFGLTNLSAQQSAGTDPSLVRHAGVLKDAEGKPYYEQHARNFEHE